MSFINFQDIRFIHMEHTSRCNLLCSQCARTEQGKINSKLPLQELTLDSYEKIFTPELCEQLFKVFWSGNYGDSIVSENWLRCAEYLRGTEIRGLELYTNGSAQKPEWWKNLASIFNRPSDAVHFSIDGLQDTNHLYRIGSNFSTIMKNAKAFIQSGGYGIWDYIVFDHNQHQIDQAKELALKMGFKEFNIKQTSRFIGNHEYKTNQVPPQEKHPANKNIKKFQEVVDKYLSWENYINQTKIWCKYQKWQGLFVDFTFRLWPCCWIGAPIYFADDENLQKKQLFYILRHFAPDFNDLNTHGIEDILQHHWFLELLEDSWLNDMDNKDNPRIMTCGRTCGEEYEFSSGVKGNLIRNPL